MIMKSNPWFRIATLTDSSRGLTQKIRKYFANISQIFHEYFANISQIFRVRPREESVSDDDDFSKIQIYMLHLEFILVKMWRKALFNLPR